MKELNPCPFCEGDPELQKADRFAWVVVCLECDASGPTAKTTEEAVDKWNRALRP